MNLFKRITIIAIAVFMTNTNSQANTFHNSNLTNAIKSEMMFDTGEGDPVIIKDTDEKVDCDNNHNLVSVPIDNNFTLNINLIVNYNGANISPGVVQLSQMVNGSRVDATLQTGNVGFDTFEASNSNHNDLRSYGFVGGWADLHVNVSYTKADGSTGHAFRVFSVKIGCPSDTRSRIAQVDLNKTNNSIAPNPFENELRMDLNGKAYEKFTISLYDTQGRLVKQMAASYNGEGNFTGQLYTDELPAGIYIIRSEAQSNPYSQRLIKL